MTTYHFGRHEQKKEGKENTSRENITYQLINTNIYKIDPEIILVYIENDHLNGIFEDKSASEKQAPKRRRYLFCI